MIVIFVLIFKQCQFWLFRVRRGLLHIRMLDKAFNELRSHWRLTQCKIGYYNLIYLIIYIILIYTYIYG